LQAFGATATAYELAAAVGFIGTDIEKARRWMSHSSERSSFPSTHDRRAAIRALLTAGIVPPARLAADTAAWERRYSMYCMAKHGNPKFLNKYGLRRGTERVELFHGPVGGAAYTRIGQLAVFRSAHLLCMATGVFMHSRIGSFPAAQARSVVARFRRLASQLVATAKCIEDGPGAA
jgi:hypothetical protein